MIKEIETLATIMYDFHSEDEVKDFLVENGYYCLEEALLTDKDFYRICEQFYITNLV